MRLLTATLDSAQKKHIGEPVVQVVIDDRHCGVFRPRWQQIIADSVADGPSAVCMMYDGAILRARTNPADGKLYVQRVSDPSNLSQWTAWTLLESGVDGESQIALAWDGNTIQALFYVAGDRRTIRLRQSADNGQTWSTAATVTTLATGHACTALAATLNSGERVLYCIYADTATGQTAIYTTTRSESGGEWSAPQGWGRASVATAHGLAVHGVGETLRVAAGLDRSLCTFAVTVSSLGEWPDPAVALHSDGENIAYGWPAIVLNFDQCYYIFFVASDSGRGSRRLEHIIAPTWTTVSMFPRPYAMQADYGACAVGDLSHHYLCTSRYVFRAKRWTPDASQRVTISADVHALRLAEYADRAGTLALTLRNDDGRYAAVGGSGTYEAIKPGGQVSVRLGYRTSAGEEVSYLRPFWITGTARQRKDAASRLLITATDGWGILERAQARQCYTWSSQSVLSILTALLAGFGFDVSDDGDAAWQRLVARFAINPGVALAGAVRYLLRLAGGCLIFRSDPLWESHWPSAIAYLLTPPATSSYAYGGEHGILAAQYGLAEQEATHVVALGQGDVAGEAWDWDAIEVGNEDRLALVVDRRLATTAGAETRAAEELAARQRAAATGFVIVAPNVGQEAADCITISDASAGMDEETRVVIANEIVLDREKGLFEQKLSLGATSG
jgi:hypothetical protein